MMDGRWLAGVALAGSMAGGCYLEEGPAPPQAEPTRARPAPSSEPEPADEHRGMASVVDEIRREDAQRVQDDRSDAERLEDELAARAAELSPMTAEQRQAEAKRLFHEGVIAFERGDAATARERFIDAYVRTPELHALAFNIARAAEQAGDCCTARAYYERFRDRAAADSQHAEVERRLESLVCPEACTTAR
jgi:hypothetical protein